MPNPTPAREAEAVVEEMGRRMRENPSGVGLDECSGDPAAPKRKSGGLPMTEAEIRADERAQLAARATDQERELVDRFEEVATDREKEMERGERYCHPDTGWDTPTTRADVESARTALLAALTASRERGIGEAESIAQGYAALARRMADTGGERMALSIACDIRALAAPGADGREG